MKQQHVTEHTHTNKITYLLLLLLECSGISFTFLHNIDLLLCRFVCLVCLSGHKTRNTQFHRLTGINAAQCVHISFLSFAIRMFSNSRKLKIMNTLTRLSIRDNATTSPSLEGMFLIPFPYCTTIDFLSPISNRRTFNALQTCLLFWSDFASRTVDGRFSCQQKVSSEINTNEIAQHRL